MGATARRASSPPFGNVFAYDEPSEVLSQASVPAIVRALPPGWPPRTGFPSRCPIPAGHEL